MKIEDTMTTPTYTLDPDGPLDMVRAELVILILAFRPPHFRPPHWDKALRIARDGSERQVRSLATMMSAIMRGTIH